MKVFEIAIYAIAAIALILVFFTIIMPFFQPTNNITQIKQGIENAKISTNLGKTISLGPLRYSQGAMISTTEFDKTNMLVSIECTSPKDCCARTTTPAQNCTQPITWSNTSFNISQAKNISTYVRCTKYNELPLCKIFFGATPAQAKIENIDTNYWEDPTINEFKLNLKNTGSLPILNASVSVELFKKGASGWTPTDFAFEPKIVETIMPGEKSVIYAQVNPQNLGEYRAKFIFTAQEAGFDSKEIDFNKSENYSCIALTITDTLIDPNTSTYKELHSCSGCNYAFECANAWNEKENTTIYSPESKDTAYCVKQTFEGSC